MYTDSSTLFSQPLIVRVLSRVRDHKFLTLLILPISLLFINDNWLFSYVLGNFVDSWIYLGYFLDLKQHLNVFPKAYFGTRLPWVLPGYLTHTLFSPILATYVLHFVFYYAAIASLYLILKRLFGQRTGLLTAVLMGCYFFFLDAIGSDYIDGAGVTYLLLTLLMITDTAKSKYMSLRLCFAGVFYGCLIYTQLFLITYTPLIILYYFFINEKQRILSLIYVVLGFIGFTLLLCTINYHLTGRFWFLKYVIKWTSAFVGAPNPWWQSLSLWWKTATWLLLPVITFLGGGIAAVRSAPHRKPLLFFQAYFILTALIHLIWQIKFEQPVLNLPFYASYLIPATFLVLGAQLASPISRLSWKQFYSLLAVSLLISLLAYFPPIIQWAVQFNLVAFALLLGLAGFIMLAVFRRKGVGIFLVVTSIVTINLCGTRAWPVKQDTNFRKDALLSVFKSVEAIQDIDPESKSRFWYNDGQPYGAVYRSVASTYLWAYRLINEEFPLVHGKNFTHYRVALNDRIFILSNEENVMEQVRQNLFDAGFRAEFLDERTIEQGSIRYKITYIKVVSL